jgi:hypothetical protein
MLKQVTLKCMTRLVFIFSYHITLLVAATLTISTLHSCHKIITLKTWKLYEIQLENFSTSSWSYYHTMVQRQKHFSVGKLCSFRNSSPMYTRKTATMDLLNNINSIGFYVHLMAYHKLATNLLSAWQKNLRRKTIGKAFSTHTECMQLKLQW